MADPADAASTESPHHRRRETRAASGVPSVAQGAGCRVGGGASSEPAPGERARLALDDAESAARLLENALVSVVEENELSMPAVGRLYAALREAEAAVGALEARLPGPPCRWPLRAAVATPTAAAVVAVEGDSGEAVTKVPNGYRRAFYGGDAESRYGSSEESKAREA